MSDARRRLPNMNAILDDPQLDGFPRELCKALAREVLQGVRQEVADGGDAPDGAQVASRVQAEVAAVLGGRARPVINATGVVLHTNLGRAPWPQEARDAASRAMGYGNVELDLATGSRGGRLDGVSRLLHHLVGCEAAIVVNNCASAVLLALTAFARDREVLVSRGELVEIGGSFRVPDVIASGGARLVDVGTTNRTRIGDYAAGITEDTAVILKVHRSNFKLVGFTEEPSAEAIAQLADSAELHAFYDLGSGSLDGWGVEPSVREAVASGMDLVLFSGDKLLGGPQAGLIAGTAEAVARCRKHPLYRALRVDKVTLAAVEATLALHLSGGTPPALRMLDASLDALTERAERLAAKLERAGIAAVVADGESQAGGGSLPGEGLPSRVVQVALGDVDRVHRCLRLGEPAAVARVSRDCLVFDVRPLSDEELEPLVQALLRAVAAAGGAGGEADGGGVDRPEARG